MIQCWQQPMTKHNNIFLETRPWLYGRYLYYFNAAHLGQIHTRRPELDSDLFIAGNCRAKFLDDGLVLPPCLRNNIEIGEYGRANDSDVENPLSWLREVELIKVEPHLVLLCRDEVGDGIGEGWSDTFALVHGLWGGIGHAAGIHASRIRG